jgi:hypothetical protein
MALVMPCAGRQLLQTRLGLDGRHISLESTVRNENSCWSALSFVLEESTRMETRFSNVHRKALECEQTTQVCEETSHEEVRLESPVSRINSH